MVIVIENILVNEIKQDLVKYFTGREKCAVRPGLKPWTPCLQGVTVF